MAIIARPTLKARRGLALACVVGLSLLAAACGGGSSGANVAHLGTTGNTNGSASDDPNAYSKCMRSHGVGNFPDPDSNNMMRMQGVDRNSPAFQAAARACLSLAPTPSPPAQQAQEQAQMLAFAQCMRSHGVPKFPDPQADGQLTIGTGLKIDPNSPIVKAAIASCRSTFAGWQKLLHGLQGGARPTGRGR